jgi:NDP-sugar pyrophosphorylase family protein
MQAVILCGGLATRLGNLSKKIPKTLLEIGGRTVLDWQLKLLKEVGVIETILASGHLHDRLYEHVGVYREGMHIRYAKEEKKLGTGGAIANAMKQIHTSPFFVLNGDVLVTDFSLEKMLERFHEQMTGLLLSVRVDDVREYGEIVSDSNGKIQTFREKQSVCRAGYINGGVYIFNQTIAGMFPKHQEIFSIERDVFPSVSDLYALETDVTWIDIGVLARLTHARQRFHNGVS